MRTHPEEPRKEEGLKSRDNVQTRFQSTNGEEMSPNFRLIRKQLQQNIQRLCCFISLQTVKLFVTSWFLCDGAVASCTSGLVHIWPHVTQLQTLISCCQSSKIQTVFISVQQFMERRDETFKHVSTIRT